MYDTYLGSQDIHMFIYESNMSKNEVNNILRLYGVDCEKLMNS